MLGVVLPLMMAVIVADAAFTVTNDEGYGTSNRRVCCLARDNWPCCVRCGRQPGRE